MKPRLRKLERAVEELGDVVRDLSAGQVCWNCGAYRSSNIPEREDLLRLERMLHELRVMTASPWVHEERE